MQNSKISQPIRQIFIRPLRLGEHETMAWAIHRLEAEFLTFFILDPKYVLFVFKIMPARLPQFRVVYVWALNLLIASNPIFIAHQLLKFVQDGCSIGEEKRRSR